MPPPLKLPPHQLISTPRHLRSISPPIRLPFDCDPIPYHAILSVIQPAHPQLLLNPFIRLKHLHSHPRHIIVLSPHHHPTSFDDTWTHTSIPRMGTSKRHKVAQLRTIIFFYGMLCTLYSNNWTTWWRWWVQLQLPVANQLILNNQLQHPITQHKARNKSTKYNWYLNWKIMKIHWPSHLLQKRN